MYEEAAEHQPRACKHTSTTPCGNRRTGRAHCYTLIADILTGIGFALLLAAGLTLRGGEVTWRAGLFWGLAGFAAFTIAPGLGLPPQVPGSETASLFERQAWWLVTAVSTGCALALFSFTRRAPWAILAALLIVLPHLYGRPSRWITAPRHRRALRVNSSCRSRS